MRQLRLIKSDMYFQLRYGFYFIYAVLLLLYLLLLYAMPQSIRRTAAIIMIFSDPAAMGMFFMGAIILLEKSQRVLNAVTVSPVTKMEYILSKIISLCIISTIVAVILGLVAGVNPLNVITAVVMGSAVFTLLGIIVGTGITTLNQFIICTVPFEIIMFLPGILHLFNVGPAWIRYYPANCIVDILANGFQNPLCLIILAIFLAVLVYSAYKRVDKMWVRAGGAKI